MVSDEGRPVLSVQLARQGNRSVYGEIEATQNGTQIALVRGIAVYPEITRREVRVQLNLPPGTSLGSGRIHIVYRAPQEEGGAVLAEYDLAR